MSDPSKRLLNVEAKVQAACPELNIVGSEMREGTGGRSGTQNYSFVLIKCRDCDEVYSFQAGRLSATRKPRCPCQSTGQWKGSKGFVQAHELLAREDFQVKYDVEAAFDEAWYMTNVENKSSCLPLRCKRCGTVRSLRITDLQQKLASPCHCVSPVATVGEMSHTADATVDAALSSAMPVASAPSGRVSQPALHERLRAYLACQFEHVEVRGQVATAKSDQSHRCLHVSAAILEDPETRATEVEALAVVLKLPREVIRYPSQPVYFEIDGKAHFNSRRQKGSTQHSGWNDISTEATILGKGGSLIRVPQDWLTGDAAFLTNYIMAAVRFCLTDTLNSTVIHPPLSCYHDDASSVYVHCHSPEQQRVRAPTAVLVGAPELVAESIMARRLVVTSEPTSPEPAPPVAGEVVQEVQTRAAAPSEQMKTYADLQRCKGKHMSQVRDEGATQTAAALARQRHYAENSLAAHITEAEILQKVQAGASQVDLCRLYGVTARILRDHLGALQKNPASALCAQYWSKCIVQASEEQLRVRELATRSFIVRLRLMGFSAELISVVAPEALKPSCIATVIRQESVGSQTLRLVPEREAEDKCTPPLAFDKATRTWLEEVDLKYLQEHVSNDEILARVLFKAVGPGGKISEWQDFLPQFRAGHQTIAESPVFGKSSGVSRGKKLPAAVDDGAAAGTKPKRARTAAAKSALASAVNGGIDID